MCKHFQLARRRLVLFLAVAQVGNFPGDAVDLFLHAIAVVLSKQARLALGVGIEPLQVLHDGLARGDFDGALRDELVDVFLEIEDFGVDSLLDDWNEVSGWNTGSLW